MSGYYAWRARGISQRHQNDAQLLEGIRQLQTLGCGLYGSDRIYKRRHAQKVAGTYAELFTTLYQEQRNPILHGKPHKLGTAVSSQDVKNSQLLSQNGLRLVMKLIADNAAWTTRDDIENWFAAP